jgi:hypothetical protein
MGHLGQPNHPGIDTPGPEVGQLIKAVRVPLSPGPAYAANDGDCIAREIRQALEGIAGSIMPSPPEDGMDTQAIRQTALYGQDEVYRRERAQTPFLNDGGYGPGDARVDIGGQPMVRIGIHSPDPQQHYAGQEP